MSGTRKGRKSLSAYRDLIGKALLAECITLEDFPVLSQFPAIEERIRSFEFELFPRGKALQSLLREAVHDVLQGIGHSDDKSLGRIAEYIKLRYQQKQSVKHIAEQWQISTVQVWRSAGQVSLGLITDRFLEKARISEKNIPDCKTFSKLVHIDPNMRE